MKKTLLILLLFLCSTWVYAQNNTGTTAKIKIRTKYLSNNQELRDLLLSELIDYHQVKYSGESLKGKNYYLIAKEIWDGHITKVDTIINSLHAAGPLESDTLDLRVTGKYESGHLNMSFFFPKARVRRVFDAVPANSDYSLREVGRHFSPEVDKNFYAFAYILPYEKNGWKLYCAVEQSGKDIENWGKEFGMKHYVIFEMKFE